MESTAVWLHPILSTFVDPDEDFVGAAAHCEQISTRAQETEDLATRRELYQHLNASLSRLYPVLNDPIPEGCAEKFIVDTLPQTQPVMDTESDLLCEYCLALSELLAEGRLTMAAEETLQGLLCELTQFLTDTIAAPRWLRTPEGLQPLP